MEGAPRVFFPLFFFPASFFAMLSNHVVQGLAPRGFEAVMLRERRERCEDR